MTTHTPPARRGLYALTGRAGRRRKPYPPVVVTLVLSSGEQLVVPPESPIARAMGQVSRLLAHRCAD
jgi:hypothetical protein